MFGLSIVGHFEWLNMASEMNLEITMTGEKRERVRVTLQLVIYLLMRQGPLLLILFKFNPSMDMYM